MLVAEAFKGPRAGLGRIVIAALQEHDYPSVQDLSAIGPLLAGRRSVAESGLTRADQALVTDLIAKYAPSARRTIRSTSISSSFSPTQRYSTPSS